MYFALYKTKQNRVVTCKYSINLGARVNSNIYTDPTGISKILFLTYFFLNGITIFLQVYSLDPPYDYIMILYFLTIKNKTYFPFSAAWEDKTCCNRFKDRVIDPGHYFSRVLFDAYFYCFLFDT